MEESNEDLKLKINNLIWMYAPDTLTLAKAEDLAIRILTLITETGKQDKN